MEISYLAFVRLPSLLIEKNTHQIIPNYTPLSVQIIRPNLLLPSHLSRSTLLRKILNLDTSHGEEGKGLENEMHFHKFRTA